MTATSEQKPNPDTRYVKQGEPKGDFASGERTTSTIPKVEDFASGEHTLPAAVTAVEDFASGEHTLPAAVTAVEDFASGEHTLPTAPENPDLVQAIPPVLIVPDQKA